MVMMRLLMVLVVIIRVALVVRKVMMVIIRVVALMLEMMVLHCGLRGGETGTKMPYDDFSFELKYMT